MKFTGNTKGKFTLEQHKEAITAYQKLAFEALKSGSSSNSPKYKKFAKAKKFHSEVVEMFEAAMQRATERN